MYKTMNKPVVLCILDGWGQGLPNGDNAVHLAHTPNFDQLWAENPHAELQACGEAVGLPAGQIGNSEVGHLNIGAGRVVFQELPRIDNAIGDGSLVQHSILKELATKQTVNGRPVHLMGLVSPGGVHAHERHILALAKILYDQGLTVYLHLWLDGRDVLPQSASETLPKFIAAVQAIDPSGGRLKLATMIGRYYAMDRDNRWDRTEKAYALMVDGKGEQNHDFVAALQTQHAKEIGDEFMPAFVQPNYPGIQNGDAIVVANFRADRVRQILTCLTDTIFGGFVRIRWPRLGPVVTITDYGDALRDDTQILFPPQKLEDTVGTVVAAAGMHQLRIAETEKYPHVTYFLNGGSEVELPGESRIMVPSPKVATYDLAPEMSARELTAKLLEHLQTQACDLVIINYANPDMVGHTGVLAAAIKAVETVDDCLGQVAYFVRSQDGAVLITADHGNCEMMTDPGTGGSHTAHTLNKVPVILVGGPVNAKLQDGQLADLAPTLLQLLNLPQPVAMTGKSLIS